MSVKQIWTIDRDKNRYAAELLAKAEAAVQRRRVNMRSKMIHEIYDQSGIQVKSYNKKNSYLEERIESSWKYYNQINDLYNAKNKNNTQ